MSHHISGPRAMAESAADITDLFALPSPEQPGPAVLARTSLPAWRPQPRPTEDSACLARSLPHPAPERS